MTTHVIPLDHCPACGHQFDRCTLINQGAVSPRPGDLTVCIKCGTALEFDGELNHRLVDLDTLPSGERAALERIQAAVRRVRAS